MSVLIKGLDMPVDGKEIHLRIDSHGEVYVYNTYPTMIGKAVEVSTPHGRLIEELIAYDKISEQEGGNFVDMDLVGLGLAETPTAIEAEE